MDLWAVLVVLMILMLLTVHKHGVEGTHEVVCRILDSTCHGYCVSLVKETVHNLKRKGLFATVLNIMLFLMKI